MVPERPHQPVRFPAGRTVNASFVVFVDESGDEGSSFGRGSSDWFVLSAIIVSRAQELAAVGLVDEVRAELGRPARKPLHFRDLRHEQRLPFVDRIARAPLVSVSVLVHKPSLREPERFRDRFRVYHYATRYLLERVSWCCRDHRPRDDGGDGSAEIVFSNRGGMSCEELRDYLDLLRDQSAARDIRIEWGIVRSTQVLNVASGKRLGLQVADAVASSFFYAVQRTRYGHTEPRYAQMLKPVVYHYRGAYLGYGVKVRPGELVPEVARGGELGWLAAY